MDWGRWRSVEKDFLFSLKSNEKKEKEIVLFLLF
jgi:hypothetical protein